MATASRSPRKARKRSRKSLWMAFFPHLHDASRAPCSIGRTHHPSFERFYRDHIRKLLAVRGGGATSPRATTTSPASATCAALSRCALRHPGARSGLAHRLADEAAPRCSCAASAATRRQRGTCAVSGISSSARTAGRSISAIRRDRGDHRALARTGRRCAAGRAIGRRSITTSPTWSSATRPCAARSGSCATKACAPSRGRPSPACWRIAACGGARSFWHASAAGSTCRPTTGRLQRSTTSR